MVLVWVKAILIWVENFADSVDSIYILPFISLMDLVKIIIVFSIVITIFQIIFNKPIVQYAKEETFKAIRPTFQSSKRTKNN